MHIFQLFHGSAEYPMVTCGNGTRRVLRGLASSCLKNVRNRRSQRLESSNFRCNALSSSKFGLNTGSPCFIAAS